MATRPTREKRPSGLVVVLAFSIAIAAATGLVVAALVLRGNDGAAPPPSTSAIDFAGIPQDGTVLGSPKANVTLIEYADLQCPACRNYSEAVLPTVVADYVRPGKLNAEFRGVAFIGPDSEKALRLVYAAGMQNRLWQLQEALYRNQGGENSGWLTDELVRELASGIPGLDVGRLFADADTPEVAGMIEEVAGQADAAEVPGTPSLFIQIGDEEPYMLELGIGSAELFAALDDALAG
ncbi:MAG: thioredoxin domain-containing protein [Gaiellaceae bacterium]